MDVPPDHAVTILAILSLMAWHRLHMAVIPTKILSLQSRLLAGGQICDVLAVAKHDAAFFGKQTKAAQHNMH